MPIVRRVLAGLALVAGVASAAGAAPSDGCAGVELTFDAAAGAWQVNAPCAGAIQIDATGRPTVYVGRRQRVAVAIVNINPLLYRAGLGDVSTSLLPEEKDLAALIGLMGDLFRAALAARSGPPASLDRAVTALQASLRRFDAERAALVLAAQALEFEDHVTATAPAQAARAWASQYADVRAGYDAVADGRATAPADVVKAAASLLDKQSATLKSVMEAFAAARRACLAAGPGPCATEDDLRGRAFVVPRRITLAPIERAAAWDEIELHPVRVQIESPYANEVVTALPARIDTSFQLASPQGSLLDVSVGVLVTSVASRTWSAVADPANPSRRVVTETARATRAGIKALLGSYAFSRRSAGWAVRPVLEFGASLQSSAPGLVVGAGVVVFRFLRAGAGVTWQQVTALDGQQAGVTIVASSDEIRTRTAWTSGAYVSFGLSLGSLGLFGK